MSDGCVPVVAIGGHGVLYLATGNGTNKWVRGLEPEPEPEPEGIHGGPRRWDATGLAGDRFVLTREGSPTFERPSEGAATLKSASCDDRRNVAGLEDRALGAGVARRDGRLRSERAGHDSTRADST